MTFNSSGRGAMEENDGDLQRFSAMVVSAVLLLAMCLGGFANSWLIYLLLKQRLRFVKDTFAPFALSSDWCVCCVGSSAFILENVSIIALTDPEYVYWTTGCMIKLTVTLFHVLMVTMCFILHVTGTFIENYYDNLGTRYVKWRQVSAYLIWVPCLAIPIIYATFLVLSKDVVKLDMPRCAMDQIYLPVIFVCFAVILVCLSAVFAMVYRTRGSRRVFAANIRTSFVVSTGGEEQPCSSKQTEIAPSAVGEDSEEHVQRYTGAHRLSDLQTVTEERDWEVKPKISFEIETSFLEPGSHEGGPKRNRRPTPSPVRKFSFTTTGSYTPSESKDGRLSELETTAKKPATTAKTEPTPIRVETEQTEKQPPLPSGEPSLPNHVETEHHNNLPSSDSNDGRLASNVKTRDESFRTLPRKDPLMSQTGSFYKRSRENGRFLSITSARSSFSPRFDDKLPISPRASEARSSMSSFRSLPSKTSLRLSILNRVSEEASDPRNRSPNSCYSRNSQISRMTTGDGHFETQDLSYTTVSWISIGVLMLSFLLDFVNSLFVVGGNRYTLTTLSNTMLYVAAAARPFIYIRCNKCLWKRFIATHLSCCDLQKLQY